MEDKTNLEDNVESLDEKPTEDIRSEAEKELEQLKNNLLLKAAEFDNMKKRLKKELDESLEYSNKRIILTFLEIIENLNRAVMFSKSNKDFDSLLKGVEMTITQFNEALKSEKVKVIDALHTKFDANLHHAIEQEENDNFENDTVISELAKGYIMGDRVIKHTLVKVSKKQKDVKNG